MDRLKNYTAMNQTSFVSIQEDGTTCLKHLVGYASPKLTPKHARSVKQSKRRTKSQEAPHFEFPPPPSFPPPEHYDLSDEYSPDLIDNDGPNCGKHHHHHYNHSLNEDGSIRFTGSIGEDQSPEGFWNSPAEAPWSYFLGRVDSKNENKGTEFLWDGGGGGSIPRNKNDYEEANEFWNVRQGSEGGWVRQEVDLSTPFVERKNKAKKKSKKQRGNDETDHIAEEIMLINKLKEDFNSAGGEKNLAEDVEDFRSEIWVSTADEEGAAAAATTAQEKDQDGSCVQIKNNHISNVLITHGNDEILDNFIENKPIHEGGAGRSRSCSSNSSCGSNGGPREDDRYEVHLINNYPVMSDGDGQSGGRLDDVCEKCNANCVGNERDKARIVSGESNNGFCMGRSDYSEGESPAKNFTSSYPVDYPDAYSYAYYEPGPVTRINPTIPENGKKYGCDRNSRYTYTTRYGTEENIYEEITEVCRDSKNCFFGEKTSEGDEIGRGKFQRFRNASEYGARKAGRGGEEGRNPSKSQSQISLGQSIVDEEVREVQSTHKRVLGQLNLTMEEMLMPSLTKEVKEMAAEPEARKTDVSDENHSGANPMAADLDSGFSGSSGTSVSFYGGSSYGGRSAGIPFRRGLDSSRNSVSSNSRIYPQIRFGCGDSNGTADYRGGERGCCAEKCLRYRCNDGGRIFPGENGTNHPQSAYFSPAFPFSSRDIPNFQRRIVPFPNYSADGSSRRNSNSATKSQSLPRATTTTTTTPAIPSGGFSKRSTGSGSGSSWAKRGWKKLTGLAIGSTNKVNVLDEPHAKASGWEHGHNHGRASSEDSWCSGSDNDLSSGDESSERSATSSTRSNGQLRQTLNKARTLCDKFRPHALRDPPPGHDGGQPPGRLSRWFSIRRGSSNQYELDNGQDRLHSGGKMPLLSEVDEESLAQSTGAGTTSSAFSRRQLPPTLPAPPLNLTPQQLKRRHIVAAIVHSENSYVATLQRLVNDYKKPLEESSPAILSSSKISTLFLRLPEILQCHTLFRIALAEAIRTWDKDERIGDVFVASFSKSIVLDVYSGFINNFSIAMDLAKTESKRKSALADFLKVKQISSHDRLSFFGLMVKPVQRFPQFILFLQDLLKHTPQGHHDRMSLQLALTQLESLAEMLNERKRESEQFQAFKEMLRHVSGKFVRPSLSDSDRYLLREDNVTQLEFNQNGMVTKSKNRRLLLLNDLLVCVSVAPKSADDFTSSERLTLKWSHPVTEIEIQDTSASPTLSRLLTAGLNRSGSLKKESNADGGSQQPVDSICHEMADLMHDYEVLSRITELIGTLKGSYKDLTVDSMKNLTHGIQCEIQKKDEVMSWVDSCCLQINLKSKNKEETITFQTDNPSIKKEWITELRLAQLALDVNNSPAWEFPEEEQRPSTKMPLFVKAQNVYSSKHQTEVKCGCFYTIATYKASASHRRTRHQNYLWVCTSDGVSSHISILAQQSHQASQLKPIQAFDLVETRVTCMEFVKGVDGPGLEDDLVWMGTDSCKLIIFSASEPEKEEEVATLTIPSVAIQIRYHSNSVFVAAASGNLLIYQRNDAGNWPNSPNLSINLGSDPVSSLLPINSSLYAACGKKVSVHCVHTGEIQRSFSVLHDQVGNVNLMAHSGVGLWISLKNSSTICLYHTETFKHLQDINIASNVLRVTSPPNVQCGNRDCTNNNRTLISVTSLMACKGLLWVGTNVGIALTIPLPRLEGVPIISGRVNISYHAHFGAISFLLALQPKSYVCTRKRNCSDEKKLTVSDKSKHQLTASPVMLRKKKAAKETENARRTSKTLPRGIFSSSSSSQSSNEACDVYGLYGELMNCKDFESEEPSKTDPIYESLRRSDPDLSALPGKISTLDRRLKMKTSRPRSLDLSNWSVESHTSSLYTSSGSEECIQKHKSELNRANSNNEGKQVRNKDLKRSGSTGALPACVTFDEEIAKRRRTAAAKEEAETEAEKKEVEGKAEGETKVVDRCKVTLSKCKTMKGVAVDSGRRTIITLMGGRGYVNWRQTCCTSDKQKSSNVKEPDSNDAHIVIWEMKL